MSALTVPTMAEGDTWRGVGALTVDTEALGNRVAFEHLDQLALEHLYGIR